MRSALVLVGMVMIAETAFAERFDGTVVGVTDGDTITVLDSQNRQHKVRLAAIDAPERGQPWGNQSRSNLGALAFNQTAELRCHKQDRYRRDVCVVFINGKDVGLEQIAAGMAWWYRDYAKEQEPKARVEYEVAEFQAKSRRLGLWSDTNPVPPWQWRREK